MRATISLLIFFCLCGPSLADKLPKTAVPMPAAEVKAVYEGKTSDWQRLNTYFSPDGKIKSITKNSGTILEGTWQVKDNQMCQTQGFFDEKEKKQKTFDNCWTWFKDGKKQYTLADNEKDKTNGYFTGEAAKFTKGDLVTGLIAKRGKTP